MQRNWRWRQRKRNRANFLCFSFTLNERTFTREHGATTMISHFTSRSWKKKNQLSYTGIVQLLILTQFVARATGSTRGVGECSSEGEACSMDECACTPLGLPRKKNFKRVSEAAMRTMQSWQEAGRCWMYRYESALYVRIMYQEQSYEDTTAWTWALSKRIPLCSSALSNSATKSCSELARGAVLDQVPCCGSLDCSSAVVHQKC